MGVEPEEQQRFMERLVEEQDRTVATLAANYIEDNVTQAVIDTIKRVTKKPPLQRMQRTCLLELQKAPPDQFVAQYKKYLHQVKNTVALQRAILNNIKTYIESDRFDYDAYRYRNYPIDRFRQHILKKYIDASGEADLK